MIITSLIHYFYEQFKRDTCTFRDTKTEKILEFEESKKGGSFSITALLHTLINLLLLSPPRSWRPEQRLPCQAVSPQAVDTAPTDQIKNTQLRRPDTGSLSTQLSGRTHTQTDRQTLPLLRYSPHSGLSAPLPPSDTLHMLAHSTEANFQLSAILPDCFIFLGIHYATFFRF